MRRSARRWTTGVAVAVALAAGACSRPSEPESGAPELPAPAELERMDRSVQAQYREWRDALDRLLAAESPEPAELAEAYGRLGMWGHVYADPAMALAFYEQAQRVAPDEFRWHYYASLLSARRGEVDAARAGYQQAIALRPRFAVPMVRLGELELEQQRLDEAERWFAQALERDPDNARARFGLGRVALLRGDAREAVGHLEAARELDEGSEGIRYSLGMAYRRLGDSERARQLLDGVSADRDERASPRLRDPMQARLMRLDVSARAERRRGRRAVRAGRPEDAITHFRAAVAAQPEGIPPRMSLADALQRTGDVDAAITEYELVLRIDPNHARSHLEIGLLLERRGPPGAGEARFREALRIDPNEPEANLRIGLLEQRAGHAERADAHFARAFSARPDDAGLRARRAHALLAAGRWQTAATALAEDRSRFPDDPILRTLQARLLAAAPEAGLRDGARSLELALEGLESRPPLYRAETLAMAYAERGDLERARAWQQAALAAARAAGKDRLAWLGERLSVYESGRPVRQPVLPDERLDDGVRVRPPAG